MNRQADPPATGANDAFSDYRRLAVALSARALRLKSRDPEAVAQETLRRSLENGKSRAAVRYYLGGETAEEPVPEWPLEQLLAWLHGVLQNVVREERSRAGFRRELPSAPLSDPADPSPDALDALVEQETRAIAAQCFAGLDRDYRDVLNLRVDGLKYGEIAQRLGLNENTVATRISRGIRELGKRIRERMGMGTSMDGQRE